MENRHTFSDLKAGLIDTVERLNKFEQDAWLRTADNDLVQRTSGLRYESKLGNLYNGDFAIRTDIPSMATGTLVACLLPIPGPMSGQDMECIGPKATKIITSKLNHLRDLDRLIPRIVGVVVSTKPDCGTSDLDID